jgi:RNA polymerase sigma factor (sigma-70 family)
MWENRRERVAMATSSARPSSSTRDDRELATLAIAGDGDAFALLYDRHERRVFGFCLRMLGNPDEAADATQETFIRLLGRLPALQGRDVNFIAYALTTARNACYDTIAARRRVEPVAEQLDRSMSEMSSPIGQPGTELSDVTRDPERAALLAAAREDVRAANARLPERQREVLALRELEQLSYEQIGEIVGLNENAVAQLISRARIRLRDLIRGDALESIASSSPDCERALPLLARRQDDQRSGAEELDWLRMHMTDCDTCRSRRAAMEEAGASYRALGPIVPLAWLRHTTIARAAQLVGADWSHLASSAPNAATSPASQASPAGARAQDGTHTTAGAGPDQAGVGAWLGAVSLRMRSSSGSQRSGGHRLRWLIVAAGLCAILAVMVLLAGSVIPDGRVLPQSDAGSAATPVTALHDRGRARIHAGGGPAHHVSAPASGVVVSRAHGSALAVVVSGGVQASGPTPVVRHAHHHGHTAPSRVRHPSAPKGSPTPTSGAPSTQPTTTTTTPTTPPPTATTPTPSPPSGESSGGGSGTTTTTPTETPGGSPGGSGSTEPEHGCALAIACH